MAVIMNLYFRLLFFIIKAFFTKKRIGVLEEVVTTLRVLPNDLDINRHMNNGRYLTVMDFGRLDYLAYTGILRLCIKNKWMPVLGAAQIRYKKSLCLWQKYDIVTQLEYWDDKWFVMSQNFRANGKIVATAMVKGLLRNKKGHISPPEIFARLNPGDILPPQPALKPEVQRWLNQL